MLVNFHLVADISDLPCQTALFPNDSLILDVELKALVFEVVSLFQHDVKPVSQGVVYELVL